MCSKDYHTAVIFLRKEFEGRSVFEWMNIVIFLVQEHRVGFRQSVYGLEHRSDWLRTLTAVQQKNSFARFDLLWFACLDDSCSPSISRFAEQVSSFPTASSRVHTSLATF